MRLRLRDQQGTRVINVANDICLADFNTLLETDTSNSVIALKIGFPPHALDLAKGNTSLIELGVKDGDQIIVEYGKKPIGVISQTESISNSQDVTSTSTSNTLTNVTDNDIPAVFLPTLEKYLILRNIPDDNSCLFNSVSYAANGYGSTITPTELRQVIVNYINEDDEKYNETILGRPNQQYCQWILKKDSWGGAIELGILSDWLNLAIYCLDIELGKFIKFENEDSKPQQFCILIYSGIHYDLLVLNDKLSVSDVDKKSDISKWDIDFLQPIIEGSETLCKLLQSKNYSTNTTTFRVRCLECYEVLVGEMGASNHANTTGHYKFGEVK